jgi:hypothetical protein
MRGREGGRVVRAEREEATPSGFRGTTRPREACYDVGRGARGEGQRARSRRRRPTHPRVGVRVFSYATDGDAKNCVVPSIVGKASEPETRVEGETHPSSPMRPAPMAHASLFPARRRVAERTQLRTVTDGSPCRSTRTREKVSASSRLPRSVCARAVATTGDHLA